MQDASDLVANQNKSERESAKLYDIHYSTLQRCIKKQSASNENNEVPKNTDVGYAKPRQILSFEQEEELVSM